MAATTQNMKIVGHTAGSTLTIPLQNLTAVSIANAFRNIGSWFQSIGIGSRTFYGGVYANGAVASGTITLSSFVAGNTVTINGVVLTSAASPSGQSQFLSTGGDTVVAAAIAACINAHTSLYTVVSATSALGVVTVSMLEPGLIGNLGTLAISANGSVSGANLTGGTDGTYTALAKGLSS